MPEAAKRSTHADFSILLTAAANTHNITLRCFDISGAAILDHDPCETPLWASAIDALIVTGTEPVAASMTDEPSWPALVKLIDWAAQNTVSTLWSCLAAQAAVLRIDGIMRHRFSQKLSGIFACARQSDHFLLENATTHWPVPHSRYHGLAAEDLQNKNYRILSGAPNVGPDMFVRTIDRSLFVLLQGHPEYSADCLLREYRRDFRRYLLGQRPTCPELPEHYFSPDIAQTLQNLRNEQNATTASTAFAEFEAAAKPPAAPVWAAHAVRLYKNWLHYIAEQKSTPARWKTTQRGFVLS
jgi:homoserine O-succinyltransferase